jgi:mono/diheme cytochrome c family protein
VLAWRSPIAPIAPPASTSFPPELVAKGEALAGGGYCATCHTAKGGQKLAGGYAMQTPFGVIYSTNITPDPETGIGTWTETAFARAMREGVARDGSHLFPAFPYTHFPKLSDNDVRALYAYLMTRPPVRAAVRANGLPFPLNIRALQAGMEIAGLQARAVPARCRQKCRMESRRLSGAGFEPLRRLPHATEFSRRGEAE